MHTTPTRGTGNAVSTLVYFVPLMALFGVGLVKAGCWLVGVLLSCF